MFVKFFLKFISFTLLSSLSLDSIINSNNKPVLKRDFTIVSKTGLSKLPKSLGAVSNPATLPSPVKPFIKKIIIKNILKNQSKTYTAFKNALSINELNDFEITFITADMNGIKWVTSSAMFDGWANTSVLPPITVHGKTENSTNFNTHLSITRSFETPVKTYYYSKIRFTILLENMKGRITKQIVEVNIN